MSISAYKRQTQLYQGCYIVFEGTMRGTFAGPAMRLSHIAGTSFAKGVIVGEEPEKLRSLQLSNALWVCDTAEEVKLLQELSYPLIEVQNAALAAVYMADKEYSKLFTAILTRGT